VLVTLSTLIQDEVLPQGSLAMSGSPRQCCAGYHAQAKFPTSRNAHGYNARRRRYVIARLYRIFLVFLAFWMSSPFEGLLDIAGEHVASSPYQFILFKLYEK